MLNIGTLDAKYAKGFKAVAKKLEITTGDIGHIINVFEAPHLSV